MAVKMVHAPLTVVHSEYHIMTNDTAAMKRNIEALGREQDSAAQELNGLLNDGYTRIDSQVYSSGAGSFMLIVLYKPDAPPEVPQKSADLTVGMRVKAHRDGNNFPSLSDVQIEDGAAGTVIAIGDGVCFVKMDQTWIYKQPAYLKVTDVVSEGDAS